MGCSGNRDALLKKLDVAEPILLKPRPPDAEKPPKRWMRIVIRPSIGMITTTWSIRYLNAGHPRMLTRLKSFLTWVTRLPLRGWGFVRSMFGPKVSLDEFEKRMNICVNCQSMQVRLIRNEPFKKLYCGSCGCPRWPPSELPHKNWLLKWECPLNKHKRLSDPPEWKGIVEEERRWTKENQDEDKAAVANGGDAVAVRGSSVPPKPGVGGTTPEGAD